MYWPFDKLWQGEMSLARTFLLAHVVVWLVGVFFFQLLSVSISMAAKPAIGVPLGVLFVVYNFFALVSVARSARRRGSRRVFRIAAVLTSVLLLALSVWVPLYFLGRPIFLI
jgi:hypothetical protein